MKVGDLVRVGFGCPANYHGILLAFHPYCINGRDDLTRGDWTILFNDGDVETFKSATFGDEMTVEVISESR